VLTTQPRAAKSPAIRISVTEAQFLKIQAAAQWLASCDRDAFTAAVAANLRGHELDDGLVARSICAAFKEFYKPLQLTEAPRPRAYFKRVD
jgi:hypothetical protein